jgi:hypothetical protein
MRPSAIVVVALAAACSSAPAHRAVVTTTTVARVAACARPTRFGVDGARPHEVHIGPVWGLVLGPGSIPPQRGDQLKIVWRVTGDGPLRVVFTGPDGKRRPLVFGPERHGESTYHRPGDEWGTGFRFTATGCWHIHVARGGTAGDVWLDV